LARLITGSRFFFSFAASASAGSTLTSAAAGFDLPAMT
jgi:hypothetical protein